MHQRLPEIQCNLRASVPRLSSVVGAYPLCQVLSVVHVSSWLSSGWNMQWACLSIYKLIAGNLVLHINPGSCINIYL